MNLTKLFETQEVLDERIVKEKGLEGQDLLPEKILALQVELGELANEWRGFKFWSEDREPRTLEYYPDEGPAIKVASRNPMLEEYVDCLHFILSIGNYLNIEKFTSKSLISFSNNITGQFNSIFRLISRCDVVTLLIDDTAWRVVINNFLHLGEMLGFTWEQIERAYYDKNKINHERQESGY